VVHLDTMAKVRTRRGWGYKDKLDPGQKGMWLRNGVAMGAKVQSYVRTRNEQTYILR
jgi:hypothetical protein